ncbi:heat shock protein 60 family chaperone groel / thermosome subunit [hydrocarbon metagenome]|uniref:Heat shock protein 60 family chaperone groel / thermosome subunit n=1 Tax=hydrocarbon metagenome TaxID=938273 RepID=A0A0W8E7B4_9ZZZZ
MSDHMLTGHHEAEENFRTLLNNTTAAQAVSRVVEGTIGPKGLDVMLVDNLGRIAVSNDGLTILKLMEANHPVARMIISAVKSQQSEVGDGTTTTAILAAAIIAEGSSCIFKGVPVSSLVQGIDKGIKEAIRLIDEVTVHISSLDHKYLFDTALIAGRGHEDIAGLVVDGASLIGMENLLNPGYKLVDAVVSCEAAADRVFNGVIIKREPINMHILPEFISNPVIIVINDALGPGKIDNDALKTDSGFKHYMQSRDLYEHNLQKIRDAGVNLVVVDRGIDDMAEEFFSRSGIAVVQRVSAREIDDLCRHTGAQKLKRSTLDENLDQVKQYTGCAEQIRFDKKHRQILVHGGRSESFATILVGASTREAVEERERIAQDAAAAVQAAVQDGIVAGGGTLEVWLAERLQELADAEDGLSSYGISSVSEALKRPFLCMTANAGLNPLKKLGEVLSSQKETGSSSISLDYSSEKLVDAFEKGIVDPAGVKINALKTAGEVAASVLRINMIIKMQADKPDNTFIN